MKMITKLYLYGLILPLEVSLYLNEIEQIGLQFYNQGCSI